MKQLKKLINSLLDKFEGLSEEDKIRTMNSPIHTEQWYLLFQMQSFLHELDKALKDPTMQANGEYARGYRDCLEELRKRFNP